MTRSRSPSMLSSRVIGRSSQSGPLQGVVTLGTIGQMALFFSSLKCQHYYDSGQPRTSVSLPFESPSRPRTLTEMASSRTVRVRTPETPRNCCPNRLQRPTYTPEEGVPSCSRTRRVTGNHPHVRNNGLLQSVSGLACL